MALEHKHRVDTYLVCGTPESPFLVQSSLQVLRADERASTPVSKHLLERTERCTISVEGHRSPLTPLTLDIICMLFVVKKVKKLSYVHLCNRQNKLDYGIDQESKP